MKKLLCLAALSTLVFGLGLALHLKADAPGWAVLPGTALCAVAGLGFGFDALVRIGGGLGAVLALPFRALRRRPSDAGVASPRGPVLRERVTPTF